MPWAWCRALRDCSHHIPFHHKCPSSASPPIPHTISQLALAASQQTLVDWMDSIREEDPESGWVTPQPTTMSGVATPGGHEAGQPGTSTLTSTLAKRSVRKEGSEESRESGTSEGADDASGVTFKACAPAASDGGGDGGVGGAGGAGSRHAHASSALRGKAWSGAASTVEAAPRHADMSGFGANDDSPAGDGAGEGEGAGASVSGLGSVPLSRSSSLGHALHEALRELYVDLRPFMNRAPLSVRKETSAFRVHQVTATLHCTLLAAPHACFGPGHASRLPRPPLPVSHAIQRALALPTRRRRSCCWACATCAWWTRRTTWLAS